MVSFFSFIMDFYCLYMPCTQLIWPQSPSIQPQDKLQSFNCPQCSDTFTSVKGLEIHISKMHLNSPKDFVCHECLKSYKNKYLLKAHEKQVHLKTLRIFCNKCQRTFCNRFALQKHLKKFHKPVASIS